MAALLIGPLATTAGAAFSAPVELSATELVSGAKVALDAEGNAIAVWSYYDGKRWRAEERRISATGSVGPLKTISAAAAEDIPLHSYIAGNPNGGAIVVWSRTVSLAAHPRGSYFRIEARRISAKGQLGPVMTISTKGQRAGKGPAIASDARGNAIVAWQQKQATRRIKARRISAKGVLGRVRTLSSAKRGSENPAIASDARGNAIVAWSQHDSSGVWRVRTRQISAEGGLSSVKTLSAPDHIAGLTQVASDARGNAVVVWQQQSATRDSNRAIKARRISAKGAVGRVMTLSSAQEYSSVPQVASDARGDTIVVWTVSGGGLTAARARQLSPTGTLGPMQALSPRGQYGYSPQVGIDGSGNATTLWHDFDHLLARQISATGDLQPMQTVATEAIGNTAIAVNAEGDAFAVWTQFDGSTWTEWGSQGP